MFVAVNAYENRLKIVFCKMCGNHKDIHQFRHGTYQNEFAFEEILTICNSRCSPLNMFLAYFPFCVQGVIPRHTHTHTPLLHSIVLFILAGFWEYEMEKIPKA